MNIKKLLLDLIIRLVLFGLVFGGVYYFLNRPYKPKFKAGDCVKQNLSDEFNIEYEDIMILKVGKEEYDTLWYRYYSKQAMALDYPTGYPFKHIDDNSVKINCPKEIQVLP